MSGDHLTNGAHEQICKRCRRVCFSAEEFANHECFDMEDRLNAEIAVCNWNGELFGEKKP